MRAEAGGAPAYDARGGAIATAGRYGPAEAPEEKAARGGRAKGETSVPRRRMRHGLLVLGAALFGWRAWQKRVPPPAGTTGVSPVGVGASGALRPTAVRRSGTLAASEKTPHALYCVVDLSAGPNAEKYPVSYLNAEPKDGWPDEYKKSKLVLRRIEPGSFKMGGKYDVALTKAFYIGVFEVTQRQYELVTGGNPSESNGDTRPVEKVSYDMIRGKDAGARWPASSAVDSSSFMGKLRTRTGIDGFDLPTEAQWEYACRAGTASMYNNGGDSKGDLMKLGRFALNQKRRGYREADVDVARHEPDGKGGCLEGHTVAGSYLPSAWGLYDMHGNVWEWCLDWWSARLSSGGTNSVGWPSGTSRVARGGCWYSSDADDCTSSGRNNYSPSSRLNRIGFRVVVGPDLLKERGIAPPKPEGSSSVASESPALGSGAPAAAPVTNEKLPEETSPRPKPRSFDLGGGVTMEMVGCPAGTFMMGYGKEASGDHKPFNKPHKVTITRPFWIAKYPLTPHMVEALGICPEVSEHVKQEQKRIWDGIGLRVPYNPLARAPMPAFVQARIFRHLNEKIKNRPQGYIFRCPTSAEWEYAVKADESDPTFVDANLSMTSVIHAIWGETVQAKQFLDEYTHFRNHPQDNRITWMMPLEYTKPNPWGLQALLVGRTFMLDSVDPDKIVKAGRGSLIHAIKDNARLSSPERDPVYVAALTSPDECRLARGSMALSNWDFPERGSCSVLVTLGPDLLKERGITPPQPDANGRGAQSPSTNGQDVRSPTRAASPSAEPFKLLSERPKPLTIKLGKGEQLELMGCPAGTFTMGCDGCGPMHAPHKVTITRPFWAGKHPVTRAQWDLFMPPRRLNEQEIALGGPNGAVGNVSRKEVDEYCRQLTKKYCRNLPKGYIFRLPTIAEMEYMGRTDAPQGGDLFAKPKGLSNAERAEIAVGNHGKQEILRRKGVAWEEKMWTVPSRTPTVEVGLRKQNKWGICDVSGNVDQWAMDVFSADESRIGQWGVKSASDIPWTNASDPLFWSSEGADGVGFFVDSRLGKSWAELTMLYAKPGAKWGCLGFRVVVGPDLVKEKLSGKSDGAVVDGARSVTIFPRADTQDSKWKKRAPWRYTMKVPPANWMEPGFRDGTWKRTNKPVGHGKDAALMRMSERWTTNDIWLRRHFVWKEAKATRVTFDMFHDENVEIYLNGTRILEEQGFNASWESFSVPIETFLSAVREGDNVLAVKVHDNGAPRYFDCGLRVEVEE